MRSHGGSHTHDSSLPAAFLDRAVLIPAPQGDSDSIRRAIAPFSIWLRDKMSQSLAPKQACQIASC